MKVLTDKSLFVSLNTKIVLFQVKLNNIEVYGFSFASSNANSSKLPPFSDSLKVWEKKFNKT